MLYASHVDATYITRDAGELTIATVDGSEVVDSDSACMRLAPAAAGGREVSRMVVPRDPKLSFLGQPGSLLWHAPFNLYDGHVPIWAGFGAFDPHHEFDVPTDFVGNMIDLELVDFSGPGEMEVFNYLPGWKTARRHFSSTEQRRTSLQVGGHGHYDWTFSAPGIYALTWKARGRHYDGTVETTKPVTQYWLVGTDEQVGLPEGTTVGLPTGGVSAEEQRSAMGLEEPTGEPPHPTVGARTPAADLAAIDQTVENKFWDPDPEGLVQAGDARLALTYSDGDETPSYTVSNSLGTTHSRAPVIEVPDSTVRCVDADDEYLGYLARRSGSTAVYATPVTANADAPSFGFDTRGVDYSAIPTHSKVRVDMMLTGPEGALSVGGVTGQDSDTITPVSRNGGGGARAFLLPTADDTPTRWLFTHPGVYSTSANLFIDVEASRYRYGFAEVTFLVGNDAINAWRARHTPGAPPLPAGTQVECSGPPLRGADPFTYPELPGVDASRPAEPTASAPSAPTSTRQQPSATPTSSRLPAAEPTAPDVWAGFAPTHVVERGHMDLALSGQPGQATVGLLDGENPAHETLRDSGTFVIAVPDSAHSELPYAVQDEGTEFVDGGWTLPQVQEQDLPWLGFSTDRFDHDQADDHTVTVALTEWQGPGRMVSGHMDFLGGLDKTLDSADQDHTMLYRGRAHDHQYFFFSAPGQYRATLNYSWLNQGVRESKDIDVLFAVGGRAVDEARARVAAEKPAPTTVAVTPTTTPSVPSTSRASEVRVTPTPSTSLTPTPQPSKGPSAAPGTGSTTIPAPPSATVTRPTASPTAPRSTTTHSSTSATSTPSSPAARPPRTPADAVTGSTWGVARGLVDVVVAIARLLGQIVAGGHTVLTTLFDWLVAGSSEPTSNHGETNHAPAASATATPAALVGNNLNGPVSGGFVAAAHTASAPRQVGQPAVAAAGTISPAVVPLDAAQVPPANLDTEIAAAPAVPETVTYQPVADSSYLEGVLVGVGVMSLLGAGAVVGASIGAQRHRR
ncbi:hypothetical protein C1Y63_03300 [Corynebacterium sp. 13CS0277]|nr:hypothetical protein C1Y63_03300 [Corynebacterium sp. 13CS0277]